MNKLLCLAGVFFLLWGCKSDSTLAPRSEGKSILIQAVQFKAASGIQQKYLDIYTPGFPAEQCRFFKFLSAAALSKKNIDKPGSESFLKDGKYTGCFDRIIHSDKSYWTIKAILEENQIPDYVKKEGDVLLNPFILLPAKSEIETPNMNENISTLWDLFYTGIFLEEKELLDEVYPLLIDKVKKEYPGDESTFENIFHLSKFNGESTQYYEVAPLSLYYLSTGNLDEKLRLTESHNKKLEEIIGYYDRYYLPRGHIVIDEFTQQNKFFMWLGARQQEQAGNINKAYIYIKTTFDDEVLRNIEQFHPNNLVYLYATIRIALQFNSPQIYRYIYGALDPLYKLKYTEFKEFLEMQLLQLMD